MSKLSTGWYLLLNNSDEFKSALVENFRFFIPKKKYLELIFRYKMGYDLNLKNPRSFSEKLQWLKLYNRNPDYTHMVDKVAAKEYVAGKIGADYIIPTIAVYDNANQIEWNKLPEQFVLKCTHDSANIVICTDKSTLNRNEAIKQLNKGLKHSFYSCTKEWPYKNVPRKIICEKYMVDESNYELKDYKWFCFNGDPKALYVASDRNNKEEETKFDFFDADFNHLPIINGHPNSTKQILKPKSFEAMKIIASQLSQGIPHVRVDLYDINGNIYFGELTFFHWSGLMPFEPRSWDYQFGEWLSLPIN
ncbi:MAG: ATP-grasp fold amidoligase family protein [Bacteroidales bacterium]|nr:ATP-grasp fold amidoligase family protein [Bacteroidales bacterium]